MNVEEEQEDSAALSHTLSFYNAGKMVRCSRISGLRQFFHLSVLFFFLLISRNHFLPPKLVGFSVQMLTTRANESKFRIVFVFMLHLADRHHDHYHHHHHHSRQPPGRHGNPNKIHRLLHGRLSVPANSTTVTIVLVDSLSGSSIPVIATADSASSVHRLLACGISSINFLSTEFTPMRSLSSSRTICTHKIQQ